MVFHKVILNKKVLFFFLLLNPLLASINTLPHYYFFYLLFKKGQCFVVYSVGHWIFTCNFPSKVIYNIYLKENSWKQARLHMCCTFHEKKSLECVSYMKTKVRYLKCLLKIKSKKNKKSQSSFFSFFSFGLIW